MTIRFLTSWNGYQPGDVATLSNEAALIAGGIARLSSTVDGPFYGANHIGTFAWARLPTPSAYLAGKHAWCTDYPSVGGYGAEVVCTGSRWKSISQQHCILSPPSVLAGLLFAAGSAAALYGSTVFIPGGVLSIDDNLRLMLTGQHPTLGTATRRVDINFSTTSGGVVAGSSGLGYLSGNGTNNNINLEKVGTHVSNNVLRSNGAGLVNSGTANTVVQVENTIPSIVSDLYAGLVITPSTDTSWLLFNATVYVEFAR